MKKLLNESSLPSPIGPSVENSPFGPRWGRMHYGIDLAAVSGTEIKSPFDGKVKIATFGAGDCGGLITIKHDDGSKTRYCHCKRIDVKKGDTVKKGDVIGLTGGGASDKGRGNSLGPHLHFEYYINGVPVDPMNYFGSEVTPKPNRKPYEYSGSMNSEPVKATPEMLKTLIKMLKEKNITVDDIKPHTKDQGSDGVKKSSDVVSGGDKSMVTSDKVEVVSEDKYDMYRYPGTVILVPKNYKLKDVHVLFCGMSTTAVSRIGDFYINAVNPILDRIAVVITHSYRGGNDFEGQLDKVIDFVSKKGFDFTVNSVAGFSRGGNVSWLYAGNRSSFKFVGLIDPSTKEINVDLGSNTILECNPNQWAGNFKKKLEWYCDHKDDSKYKGKVFCTNKSHSSIMSTFYQKYGSNI